MRILCYGSKGWICGMFIKMWNEIHPEDIVIGSETRLQFVNIKTIESEILNVDRVVCMIGRTYGYDKNGTLINNIDYLEDHLYENLNDNLAMPLLLAMLCHQHNIHLSYLGTDVYFQIILGIMKYVIKKKIIQIILEVVIL